MPYSKNPGNNNLLDLAADLPVTLEDSRRLTTLRSRPELTFEEYIDFLEAIDAFAVRKSAPVIFDKIFSLF